MTLRPASRPAGVAPSCRSRCEAYPRNSPSNSASSAVFAFNHSLSTSSGIRVSESLDSRGVQICIKKVAQHLAIDFTLEAGHRVEIKIARLDPARCAKLRRGSGDVDPPGGRPQMDEKIKLLLPIAAVFFAAIGEQITI